MSPVSAILIGSITSVCCFYAISLKHKLGVDDALDTFPVHGVGGTVGALLTGVFASTAVNEFGKDGLIAGNPSQLLIQLIAVVIAYALAIVGTLVIISIVRVITPLRPSPEVETQGMDIEDHGEEGYGRDFAA